MGLLLRGVAQDHPHLVLDGAAVAGGAQPQLVADGIVELADRQIGHVAPPPVVLAMLSKI